MDNFKLNDKVWSIAYGWGEVVEEVHNSIKVKFHNSKSLQYTEDGRQCTVDIYTGNWEYITSERTLFFQEFDVSRNPFTRPLPKLKIDDRVLVWDNNDSIEHANKRHFKKFNANGKIITFERGTTSWTAADSAETEWDNFEVVAND